jgi:ABC-type Fe3+/spermidine/putrescine transport system ATPase subunit
MSEVVLQDVSKAYGRHLAVDNVSLRIQAGEFVTLLGPSGCGKTTTLRMVAGFVDPTAGDLYIDGRKVTGVPANRRNTGMVFQNFALFPHLSVAENVEFGLRVRDVPAREAATRIEEVLKLVHLANFADRQPRHLSGGQQQRVALARAVVIKPDVLLLDEPLSSLDLKLRQELQIYIKEIQRALAITTIYVTHDQGEALRMSDRIAVMNAGRIVQVDRPLELYKHPKSAFVAKFVGQTNLLEVEVAGTDVAARRCALRLAGEGDRPLVGPLGDGVAFVPGQQLLLGFRPEAVVLDDNRANSIQGRVRKVDYLGAAWSVILTRANGAKLELALPSHARVPSLDETIRVTWHPEDSFLLPKET